MGSSFSSSFFPAALCDLPRTKALGFVTIFVTAWAVAFALWDSDCFCFSLSLGANFMVEASVLEELDFLELRFTQASSSSVKLVLSVWKVLCNYVAQQHSIGHISHIFILSGIRHLIAYHGNKTFQKCILSSFDWINCAKLRKKR
jgi:hypothetical protein